MTITQRDTDTPTRGRAASRAASRALVVLGTVLAAAAGWALAIVVLDLDVKVPAGPGSTERVPLAVGPVVVMSAAAALAGWALLAVLERFTARARAIWTVVAIGVLLLTMPWMPGFTALERVVLTVLHLVVAAVLIPGLRRGSPRG